MKSAEEWIDSVGIPLEKSGAIRFVAMIQEDAVKCYSINDAIEDVEEAVRLLHANPLPWTKGHTAAVQNLNDKVRALANLKLPVETDNAADFLDE